MGAKLGRPIAHFYSPAYCNQLEDLGFVGAIIFLADLDFGPTLTSKSLIVFR